MTEKRAAVQRWRWRVVGEGGSRCGRPSRSRAGGGQRGRAGVKQGCERGAASDSACALDATGRRQRRAARWRGAAGRRRVRRGRRVGRCPCQLWQGRCSEQSSENAVLLRGVGGLLRVAWRCGVAAGRRGRGGLIRRVLGRVPHLWGGRDRRRQVDAALLKACLSEHFSGVVCKGHVGARVHRLHAAASGEIRAIGWARVRQRQARRLPQKKRAMFL